MLCEECKKNQATVIITVTAGDEMSTRHLCQECMEKMEQSFAQGDIQSFLSSLLSVLGSAKTQKKQELTCSSCGLTYSEFERTGKLGCAQCYVDFSDQLGPLLQRIHGRTQHAGRMPACFSQLTENVTACSKNATTLSNQDLLIDALRQKMDDAIASENFEDAAKYRDELRSLNLSKEANTQ